MFCSNCGLQIPEEANFCQKCGSPQSKSGSKTLLPSEEPKWETREIFSDLKTKTNLLKGINPFWHATDDMMQMFIAQALGPKGMYTVVQTDFVAYKNRELF